MTISAEVGLKIKAYRQRLNLTLKDIESRVDVSATHVSEIERGKTSPTIGALVKIAKAFEIDPAHFLTEDRLADVQVTRQQDRVRIRYEHQCMDARPLTAPVRDQQLSAAYVQWDPNMSANDVEARAHAGEEFIHVLEGAVEVTVREQTVLLQPGDSLHFRASLPHRIVNRFAHPCRALLVLTPVFGF